MFLDGGGNFRAEADGFEGFMDGYPAAGFLGGLENRVHSKRAEGAEVNGLDGAILGRGLRGVGEPQYGSPAPSALKMGQSRPTRSKTPKKPLVLTP